MSHPHKARLTLDLGALVANWRALGARAAPGKAAAVLKANAYGLGDLEVATALYDAGCRVFFVAHVEEGVRIRAAAPQADIYILHGYAPDVRRLYALHRLIPVLASPQEVALWQQSPLSQGAALQVNTGINRLGIAPQEAVALAQAKPLTKSGIRMVMTHFSAAEQPDCAATLAERHAFASLHAALRPADPALKFSLANSSGLFIAGLEPYEIARPGYALYGGNPTPGHPNPMRPVVRLEAPVLNVLDVPAGGKVGYSGLWQAPAPARIALLSIGYADGLPRSLGGAQATGLARIGATLCPIRGAISMDLTALDITALPEGAVKPGDYATLLDTGPEELDTGAGKNAAPMPHKNSPSPLTLESMAQAADTIGYEILTRLSPRLLRVYIGAENG